MNALKVKSFDFVTEIFNGETCHQIDIEKNEFSKSE